MKRLTVFLSLLLLLLFASDAFACVNSMRRHKTDPYIAANERIEGHLRRGENRVVIEHLNGSPFYPGMVDDFASMLLKHQKLTSPTLKRSVHLLAAAVVRSEGMWARSGSPEKWDQRDAALGEVEARANLEWAVSVLELLAEDSAEAYAYLMEGRYRLDGDSASAAKQLATLANRDALPDSHSWALFAEITHDAKSAEEAQARATEMLAAEMDAPKPRNERVKLRRGEDGVINPF